MSRHRRPHFSRSVGRGIALTATGVIVAVMMLVGVLSAVSFARPDHPSAPLAPAKFMQPVAPAARHITTHPMLLASNFSAEQSVKVHRGDTLSSIAAHVLGSSRLWPVLWWDNQSKLANPNVIRVGERLHFGTWHRVRPWLSRRALAAIPKPAPTPVAASQAPPTPVASSSASAPSATFSGSGFQACVIAAESGGNSQIMNSTGHYGLYQFSYSTWVDYGGAGGDFGHASVGEQNQVFDNAMATPGGNMNWSPYDGCWP